MEQLADPSSESFLPHRHQISGCSERNNLKTHKIFPKTELESTTGAMSILSAYGDQRNWLHGSECSLQGLLAQFAFCNSLNGEIFFTVSYQYFTTNSFSIYLCICQTQKDFHCIQGILFFIYTQVYFCYVFSLSSLC